MTIMLIIAVLVSVALGVLMVSRDRDELEELELSPEAEHMNILTRKLDSLWVEFNQIPGESIWVAEAILFEIKGVEMRIKNLLCISREIHTL